MFSTAIYAELTPPTDVFEAMTDRLIESPTLMGRMHVRSATRLCQRAIVQLRVKPGAPPAGITRLMTPRQRGAFWRTKGFGGGIPHVRTDAIPNGWQYRVETLDNGGSTEIYNEVPGVVFVEGMHQQPFLAAVGWLQAEPILAEFAAEMEEISIQNWWTASDIWAGVEGGRMNVPFGAF